MSEIDSLIELVGSRLARLAELRPLVKTLKIVTAKDYMALSECPIKREIRNYCGFQERDGLLAVGAPNWPEPKP